MPRCRLLAICKPLLLCLLSLLATIAQADTRAWIDRDDVALGDTLTLNIETDQPDAPPPDYAPLRQDFVVSGNSSSRQVQIVNGRTSVRMLFAVALQPRREGLLTIPSLQVGADTTQPLTVTVTRAQAPARAGSPAFIEAEIADQDPYVQQAVGYTLRLYYSAPLVSGQLDQATPDGASLQRIGSDLQYTREVQGQRYTVVERRFLLIPERSGPMTIPGARFEGRSAGGFFDDMFGDGRRTLSANGAPRLITVRPVPAQAPQPWLPLHGLSLRYLTTPQDTRTGTAATVVVELGADGATAAQMPELQLGAIDGAQVFAEPAQIDESFDDGRPQVRITRKFSVVPSRAGALRIPGPRIEWWDVRAATARTASLPDINVQVAQGDDASALPDVPAAGDAATHTDGAQGSVRPWALATMILALLWLVTLMWGLQRRADPQPRQRVGAAASPRAGVPKPGMRDLRHALDSGDLGDVADVLCAMAHPPAADLDGVRARLDDRAQAAAVDRLQRARWGDGDAPAARAALRQAFASAPQWRQAETVSPEPLPPLYPRGK